jgi:hypothetical protein
MGSIYRELGFRKKLKLFEYEEAEYYIANLLREEFVNVVVRNYSRRAL